MGLANHLVRCTGCDEIIQTCDATYDEYHDPYCESCAIENGINEEDWQEVKAREEGQRDAWLYLKSEWM